MTRRMGGTVSPYFPEIKANFQAAVMKRMDLQTLEWLYPIPMTSTVPAGDGDDQEVDIKSDAHFECFYITGDFTTLNVDGADDGVNHVSVRISDQSNDLKLMNAAIPMNLFLSPGRVRAAGVAGDIGSNLFYPFPFHHTFAASGGILAEFQNDAETDNLVHLLFWGQKLRVR